MKKLAALLALVAAVAGGLGAAAQDTGPQTHDWVNFATGYANSWGTHGNVQVHLIGVSGYQPTNVRFKIGDNGANEALRVAYLYTCWDESGILVNDSDDFFVNPPSGDYIKAFAVPITSDRCELNVLATQLTTGTPGNITNTFQAKYNH